MLRFMTCRLSSTHRMLTVCMPIQLGVQRMTENISARTIN